MRPVFLVIRQARFFWVLQSTQDDNAERMAGSSASHASWSTLADQRHQDCARVASVCLQQLQEIKHTCDTTKQGPDRASCSLIDFLWQNLTVTREEDDVALFALAIDRKRRPAADPARHPSALSDADFFDSCPPTAKARLWGMEPNGAAFALLQTTVVIGKFAKGLGLSFSKALTQAGTIVEQVMDARSKAWESVRNTLKDVFEHLKTDGGHVKEYLLAVYHAIKANLGNFDSQGESRAQKQSLVHRMLLVPILALLVWISLYVNMLLLVNRGRMITPEEYGQIIRVINTIVAGILSRLPDVARKLLHLSKDAALKLGRLAKQSVLNLGSAFVSGVGNVARSAARGAVRGVGSLGSSAARGVGRLGSGIRHGIGRGIGSLGSRVSSWFRRSGGRFLLHYQNPLRRLWAGAKSVVNKSMGAVAGHLGWSRTPQAPETTQAPETPSTQAGTDANALVLSVTTYGQALDAMIKLKYLRTLFGLGPVVPSPVESLPSAFEGARDVPAAVPHAGDVRGSVEQRSAAERAELEARFAAQRQASSEAAEHTARARDGVVQMTQQVQRALDDMHGSDGSLPGVVHNGGSVTPDLPRSEGGRYYNGTTYSRTHVGHGHRRHRRHHQVAYAY